MPVPPLTARQRQDARQAALQARRRRAEVKAALKTGTLSLTAVVELANRDDVIAHIRVVDALKALPEVGAARAAKVTRQLRIADNRRLRGLGKHQTVALLNQFP